MVKKRNRTKAGLQAFIATTSGSSSAASSPGLCSSSMPTTPTTRSRQDSCNNSSDELELARSQSFGFVDNRGGNSMAVHVSGSNSLPTTPTGSYHHAGGMNSSSISPNTSSRVSGLYARHQQHIQQHMHQQKQTYAASQLLANQPSDKKWRNFSVRALWTLIMIGAFFLIMAAGHFWVVSMVIAVQTMVYKEVIFIAHVPSKERKLPWFRTLNWYFLLATNYYFYGETIIYYFRTYMLVDAFLLPLATHHKFISFIIYCIGFVLFVANLKKGHYAFQFTQFAWTHMTLLLVVVQCHFIISNIFEGMFWFFIPVALVITNDIFAYICGFFWGRTPLIKLSPKKTVEGFIGGWVCTMICGVIFTEVARRIPYMLCPANRLTSSAWTFNASDCELNPIFEPKILNTGPWLSALLRWLFINVRKVPIAPIHWHVLLLACFASFVAPFGGFFASGLKRAVKIKDFGDSIPGHGGLTDRMDCQFLMGSFAHIYFQSFIKISTLQTGLVLQSIITGLQPKEQLELYNNLRTYLVSQELLDEPSNADIST